jgi:hypothetical protein
MGGLGQTVLPPFLLHLLLDGMVFYSWILQLGWRSGTCRV